MKHRKNNGLRLRVTAAAVGAVLLLPLLASHASAQTSDSAELPTQGSCLGKNGILVASDARAQSDVYAAVTLKGVTDGCLIWAGGRDEAEIPVAQQNRIIASDGVAYIVGGPAAVSASKQVAAAALSNGEAATRIGGADRFETAELVGAEAARLAETSDDSADDNTPSDSAQAVSLGNLTSDKTHTAAAGTSEVSAVLEAGKWTVKAETSVRGNAQFGPVIDSGSCVTATTDNEKSRPERNRHVWNVVIEKDCEAEDRTITVALSDYDLDDYDAETDGYDNVPDHPWTVSISKTQLPARLPITTVSSRTKATSTPKVSVAVKNDEGQSSRQHIRLAGSDKYWLLQVEDASSSFTAGSGVTLASDHAIEFGHIDDLDGEDDDRYASDAYQCVRAVTSGTFTQPDGDDEGTDPDAVTNPNPTATHEGVIVHVPSGCAGHIAVKVGTPDGTTGTDDDLRSWRVKVTPLTKTQ